MTLSFDLRARGVARRRAGEGGGRRPARSCRPTLTTGFQGTAQEFQQSAKGLGLLLIAAVVVIYLVMGMLYESFIHPITILSGLPSAGVGALLTLQLFDSELNLYSMVGLIMLIGIVKKNAIMMIDFALDAERTRGQVAAGGDLRGGAGAVPADHDDDDVRAARGAADRAGLGAGAESRRPLGLAVVGGLLVSQVLTLYFTPVYYIYLDKLRFRKAAAHRRRNRPGGAGGYAGLRCERECMGIEPPAETPRKPGVLDPGDAIQRAGVAFRVRGLPSPRSSGRSWPASSPPRRTRRRNPPPRRPHLRSHTSPPHADRPATGHQCVPSRHPRPAGHP